MVGGGLQITYVGGGGGGSSNLKKSRRQKNVAIRFSFNCPSILFLFFLSSSWSKLFLFLFVYTVFKVALLG